MNLPHSVQFEIVDASSLKLGVVSTRWNDSITDALLTGALEAIEDSGGKRDRVDHFRCPGAFELPLTAARMIEARNYDGIIALGVVIRGETPHFEFVAGAATDGLSALAVNSGVPIGFGLLTVDSQEQALARAGKGVENKGWEAAMTTIEMCRLMKEIVG